MIENPSKSEVIGRSGGDEKNRMTTQNRQKVECSNNKQTKKILCGNQWRLLLLVRRAFCIGQLALLSSHLKHK